MLFRTRSTLRIPAVCALLLLVTGFAPVGSVQAQTAQDYIVQVEEWQSLEDNAVRTLQSLGHSDPYLTSRNEIRAHVFFQLFQMMERNQVNAARSALIEKISEFRANAFHNTLSSHDWYASNGCFDNVDIFGCLLGDFFGGAPSYPEFTHLGTMEAFGDLTDNEQALQVKLEVVRAIKWYAAYAELSDQQITAYGTLPPEANYDAFRQFATGTANLATSQLFGDLVTMAIEEVATRALAKIFPEIASNAAGTAATTVTIVAAVIVAAYTTYHIADRTVLYNTIKDRAENPDSEPLALDKLTTTAAGMTELFEVIIAHTMGSMSVTEQDCRFQLGDNQRSDCKAYTLTEDPDYVEERYSSDEYPNGLPLPLPNSGINFWHGARGVFPAGMTVQNELTISDSQTGDFLAEGTIAPWKTYKRTKNNLPAAPSTLSNEAASWSFRDKPAARTVKAYVADNGALTSYETGNMPGRVDTSWKYSHALNYTNWNDQWWTAWMVGGQFLHQKQATKMPGTVAITEYNGGGRCFQVPPSSGPFTGAWEPQGPFCLLGNNTDFSQLSPGDEISVGGVRRVVSRIVECTERFNLFGDWQPCDDPLITDPKAVVVSAPFPEEMYSYHYFGYVQFGTLYGYDYAKWHKPTDATECQEPLPEDLEYYILLGPPADRDCYYSPLLQYKESSEIGLGNYWNALMAAPFHAADDSGFLSQQAGVANVFSRYKTYEDAELDITLPERGIFVNDRVPSLDKPDGIYPWSSDVITSVELLTPAHELHGDLELRQDGTFKYTPDAALNDWEDRNWEQHFDYELCASVRPNLCATARVTIAIDNKLARAVDPLFEVIPPSASSDDYTLQFNGYTYEDEENDPEDVGKTQICWYRILQFSTLVLDSACWFGDEPPIDYSVSASNYLDADSTWYLYVIPVAQRGVPGAGKEPGDFTGISSRSLLQGSSATDYDVVTSMSLECTPGGPGEPPVSTANEWVNCTFEVQPFVPGSVFFDTSPTAQPWSFTFVDFFLSSPYHYAHEKTFSPQFCELESIAAGDAGRCSAYFLSKPVDEEEFPLFRPDGPFDTVNTKISGTLLDENGGKVYGNLGLHPQSAPRLYAESAVISRSETGSAGLIQAPDAFFDVKHNEDTLLTLPIPDHIEVSSLVVVLPPLLGTAVYEYENDIVYSPGTDACCATDSFRYQICPTGSSTLCSLPGTVTLNIVDGERPTIVGSYTPEANAAGWHNTPVEVSFVCEDGESPIVFCSDTYTVFTEGAGVRPEGTARDAAGNSAQTSLYLNIDRLAPTFQYTVSPLGPDAYSINFTCDADLSGLVDGCPPTMQLSAAQLDAGVPVTVTDFADNSTTLTVQQVVELDTDGDGVPDGEDNCVNTPNADQSDLDADGEGDLCDDTPTGEPMMCDLNRNGFVDRPDFDIIRGALGQCQGDAGYVEEADYIGAACIGDDDYQYWYKNCWEPVAPPPPPPGC